MQANRMIQSALMSAPFAHHDALLYTLFMEELNDSRISQIRDWLGTGSINIFGIQYSGKDTVGKRLAELFDAEFISSGDVMRATYANELSGSSEVKEAARIGSTVGLLMPTVEFQEMIVAYLTRDEFIGKPLILSTVGRWIGEEGPVVEALKQNDHNLKAVILLNISEDEVMRRWSLVDSPDARNVGRADDHKEGLLRRLDEFRNKTIPVLDVYRNMGLLHEINGEQDRDKVFADVIDTLYALSSAENS